MYLIGKEYTFVGESLLADVLLTKPTKTSRALPDLGHPWSTQILYNLIQTKMTDSRFMHMQQPWHSLGSLLHKEYIPIHCIYDNIVNQSV